MSIKLRARVWASNVFSNVRADKWCATVHARDENKMLVAGRMMTADSHAEAMQAAYKMLHDLDAELMNEVHASRSSRRAAAGEPHQIITTTEATA